MKNPDYELGAQPLEAFASKHRAVLTSGLGFTELFEETDDGVGDDIT